ncbi:hypothetical protein ACQV5M_20650, partial [Leptospira sp. SA-E8]|uniref:hypothetical protein n=1 Tax=Leptospira sp. SA-E8 TaxID=3422259 RepID=UPI003EBA4665
MVSNVSNSSLLNYLLATGLIGSGSSSSTSNGTKTDSTKTDSANSSSGSSSTENTISQASLRRAAAMSKTAVAVRPLEAAQKTLSTDLRAAMTKAGVKLTGEVQFSVNSKGEVEVKGSDADKAAVKAFLKADTSNPSFASRIATQAQDALKLSTTIQQSAAISQAATLAKTSSGVISLYKSLV